MPSLTFSQIETPFLPSLSVDSHSADKARSSQTLLYHLEVFLQQLKKWRHSNKPLLEMPSPTPKKISIGFSHAAISICCCMKFAILGMIRCH
ncbi:hypothetical protein QN277_007680 [Acacia crassicarpa]|uniref:Uncharacterized protein n=1 Tax=Acacia crassicarpa TaxID=499986 RepID=A0AAE1IXJ1_9FABA|nr:hypothetical protein QN277_007680 [Acacia crassicarpa]